MPRNHLSVKRTCIYQLIVEQSVYECKLVQFCTVYECKEEVEKMINLGRKLRYLIEAIIQHRTVTSITIFPRIVYAVTINLIREISAKTKRG